MQDCRIRRTRCANPDINFVQHKNNKAYKMVTINPYLNFMDNTEKAMNFYKSVFGGQFTTFERFKDIPGGEKMSEEDQEKIMNITLPLGKGVSLMATDALESMGQVLIAGNNVHLSVHTDSEKDADKIFNALSVGGQIKLAMNKAFWGSYFGMLTDQFGIHWMVNFDLKQAK
jgi:PhnB protein